MARKLSDYTGFIDEAVLQFPHLTGRPSPYADDLTTDFPVVAGDFFKFIDWKNFQDIHGHDENNF